MSFGWSGVSIAATLFGEGVVPQDATDGPPLWAARVRVDAGPEVSGTGTVVRSDLDERLRVPKGAVLWRKVNTRSGKCSVDDVLKELRESSRLVATSVCPESAILVGGQPDVTHLVRIEAWCDELFGLPMHSEVEEEGMIEQEDVDVYNRELEVLLPGGVDIKSNTRVQERTFRGRRVAVYNYCIV